MRIFSRIKFEHKKYGNEWYAVVTGTCRTDVNTIQERVSTWVVERTMHDFLALGAERTPFEQFYGLVGPTEQIPRRALNELLDEYGVCVSVEYIDYTERDLT